MNEEDCDMNGLFEFLRLLCYPPAVRRAPKKYPVQPNIDPIDVVPTNKKKRKNLKPSQDLGDIDEVDSEKEDGLVEEDDAEESEEDTNAETNTGKSHVHALVVKLGRMVQKKSVDGVIKTMQELQKAKQLAGILTRGDKQLESAARWLRSVGKEPPKEASYARRTYTPTSKPTASGRDAQYVDIQQGRLPPAGHLFGGQPNAAFFAGAATGNVNPSGGVNIAGVNASGGVHGPQGPLWNFPQLPSHCTAQQAMHLFMQSNGLDAEQEISRPPSGLGAQQVNNEQPPDGVAAQISSLKNMMEYQAQTNKDFMDRLDTTVCTQHLRHLPAQLTLPTRDCVNPSSHRCARCAVGHHQISTRSTSSPTTGTEQPPQSNS